MLEAGFVLHITRDFGGYMSLTGVRVTVTNPEISVTDCKEDMAASAVSTRSNNNLLYLIQDLLYNLLDHSRLSFVFFFFFLLRLLTSILSLLLNLLFLSVSPSQPFTQQASPFLDDCTLLFILFDAVLFVEVPAVFAQVLADSFLFLLGE